MLLLLYSYSYVLGLLQEAFKTDVLSKKKKKKRHEGDKKLTSAVPEQQWAGVTWLLQREESTICKQTV